MPQQYKVLRKGDGKAHPTVSSPCECHYKGTLIDGAVSLSNRFINMTRIGLINRGGSGNTVPEATTW